MPYATPSSPTLPLQSQGRAGHRRSYTHVHIAAPETTAFTSTSSSLGALPRRRSAGSAPSTPGADTPQKKPTFQLGRDDDDDDEDSSGGEERYNSPRVSIRRDADDDDDDEDDDQLRRLPPLRLKVKTSPFDTAPTSLAVPFPRSSPLTSPTHSPAIAASSVPFPNPPAMHARSVSDQPAPARPTVLTRTSSSGTPTAGTPRPIRPSVSRTSSTPILLSNGKPLRSSLKSSSSSPNIPFPSQSLVPSIMWPDLHRRDVRQSEGGGHHHHHHEHHLHAPAQAHQRAASAPDAPNLPPTSPPPSLSSSLISLSPPPSLSSSITSDSTTPSSSPSAPSSPTSSPPSPTSIYHYPHHPHPPKNVHFPSQDTNLATVRVFNRSARPASVSLTGVGGAGALGEETETETEGEGSGTGGGPRWPWGYGTYGSGYGGAGASTRSREQQGYPFPRAGGAAGKHSPLGGQQQTENGESDKDDEKERTWYYALDTTSCSEVPMRGAERGEGNVYLESMGFIREDTPTPTSPPAPARPLKLTGTFLVRNIAYQKTVAVRFTLDEWHTTSEVLAKHEKSLAALPASFSTGERGKVCSPYDLDSTGGLTTTWDRFRFEIGLEDYASSRTLEGRTMWLVGRYTTGAAAAVVAASAGVGGGSGGSAAAAGVPGEEWWDNNGGMNYRVGFKRVGGLKVQERKEEARPAVPASANPAPYRRGVIVSAPSAYTPPTQGSKSYPAPPQISSSVSFPTSSAPERAQSPYNYQTQYQQSPYAQSPSPYQQHQLQQHQEQHKEHQAALAQSTLARLRKLNLRNYAAPAGYDYSSGGPRAASTTSALSVDSTSTSTSSASTADSTPVQTPVQERDVDDVLHDKAQHEHDSATPTFRGAVRPSWGAALSSVGGGLGLGGSTVKEGEVGMELGVGAGLGMGMENGYPATISPPSSANTTPKAVDISNANAKERMNMQSPIPSPSDTGTTPPFSVLGGIGSGSPIVSRGAGAGLYWPWGSFGDVGPSDNDSADAAPKDGDEVDTLLSDIKERSTSPTRSAGSGPGPAPGAALMPPQRRRKESVHRREGAGHKEHEGSYEHGHGHTTTSTTVAAPKATFSIGRGGRGSSSSSGSGSGSDSGSGSGSGSGFRTATPMQWRGAGGSAGTSSPSHSPSGSGSDSSKLQGPNPNTNMNMGAGPALWGLRPGSPRPGPGVAGRSTNGARSPLRLSPVPSPLGSRADLTTPTPASVAALSAPSGLGQGPPFLSSSATTPTATPAPTPSSTSSPSSPTQQTDDAVYQAFVRQWCFAQAPGPTVGTGVNLSGPRIPAAAGGRPKGEFEEGPRLVVG